MTRMIESVDSPRDMGNSEANAEMKNVYDDKLVFE